MSAPPPPAEPAPLPLPAQVLPHRAPFLYLDRVLTCTADTCEAERTFGAEEPFFAGHFPSHPVVPGVILIEALAQTLAYLALQHRPGHLVLMTGVESCRIRRPVRPGDRVHLTARVVRHRLNLVVADAVAEVHTATGRVKVLEARLKGMVAPPPEAAGGGPGAGGP